MPETKDDEIRELSLDEMEAVAGGWPKWLERMFGGGSSTTPGQMTQRTKQDWPPGSHWTDHN